MIARPLACSVEVLVFLKIKSHGATPFSVFSFSFVATPNSPTGFSGSSTRFFLLPVCQFARTLRRVFLRGLSSNKVRPIIIDGATLQAQGTAEAAFIQDLVVDFDCECRTFVVNGKPIRHARRYTSFAKPAEVCRPLLWPQACVVGATVL